MVGVTFDKTAVATIDSLKEPFGVSTNAEVVSKALDLARIIARYADDDHTVLLDTKDGNRVKVHLST